MKNKIRISTTLFFVILIILLDGCDPADNRLKIVNNSDSDIFFFYSCDSSLSEFEIFRSGYYSNARGEKTYLDSDQFIQANSSINIPLKGINAWTDYIKHCPRNSMNFYFFIDTIVTKYSDIEIKNIGLYQKHINISLNELKLSDWTVKFP